MGVVRGCGKGEGGCFRGYPWISGQVGTCAISVLCEVRHAADSDPSDPNYTLPFS